MRTLKSWRRTEMKQKRSNHPNFIYACIKHLPINLPIYRRAHTHAGTSPKKAKKMPRAHKVSTKARAKVQKAARPQPAKETGRTPNSSVSGPENTPMKLYKKK